MHEQMISEAEAEVEAEADAAVLIQLLDGMRDAAFVIDLEHRVTHWNRACEDLSGLSRQQVVGRCDAWRVLHETQRPMLANRLLDTALLADPAGAPVDALTAETFLMRPGTDGRWLKLRAQPLHTAEGRLFGALQTFEDDSFRRQAEAELQRHRLKLEQLVQVRSLELTATVRELELFITNAPIGVAFSSEGILQRVNRALVEMLGQDEPSLLGLPVSALNLQDTPDALVALESAAGSGAGDVPHETWMQLAEGKRIWVQIDTHQTRRGTWWMVQNRSEIRSAHQQLQARFDELSQTNRKLEEAQNQLLQQEKMASIGQLAAGVAHEINNPIGYVNSNIGTLRKYVTGVLELIGAYEQTQAQSGDARALARVNRLRAELDIDYLREDLPQLIEESREGLERVRKIVQDLKEFSRVDQADWQRADLNAGLESTLKVANHEVKYKAEVIKHLGDLPAVTCVPAQLNQVFLNLIVNAVHAIPERGTITLASGHCNDWVWVQVEDTGSGMTPEVMRRIFEPFFTTKEVGKGTGLGLSLSFSIVQKHGGTMQVRSTPGVGTAFRVWVPIGGPESVSPGVVPPAWE